MKVIATKETPIRLTEFFLLSVPLPSDKSVQSGIDHFSCILPIEKSGKCENSAQNRADYVKITPQNSTDYVKTAIFAVNNIRFATWKICLEERLTHTSRIGKITLIESHL